ncbi:MAG: plasmid mobilization relaxosome protein MobC [Curvibacter lanceolatus]|uniref:plasmid mobilization protein n=1 Tax=Curvibacter lanceolatus TaxID=86182 RepID=UPI00235572DA|nr:plasmid mobilization relaxosome protein MobC [Curvibacter lanceolatus]MBV5292433.1 plasmid mobilization relaxosome protein MobC [Curvibacter lanceolatus]
MKNNRDIFRKIRLTQEEDDYIKLCSFQKNYSSVSEYIRTCSIRPLNLDDKLATDFHKEINRIGINLNQISRKVNSNKLIDKEVAQLLYLITEQLEEAFNLYVGLKK